jgi:hypothetical protein
MEKRQRGNQSAIEELRLDAGFVLLRGLRFKDRF